jgi:small redox-active disulfide protein 2
MKISVYGGGCKSCEKLLENAKKAVLDAGKTADFAYITDYNVIIQRGFMRMPVLEIDGKIVSQGEVLKPKDIQKYL